MNKEQHQRATHQQWEGEAEAVGRLLTTQQAADEVCASGDVAPLVTAAHLQRSGGVQVVGQWAAVTANKQRKLQACAVESTYACILGVAQLT